MRDSRCAAPQPDAGCARPKKRRARRAAFLIPVRSGRLLRHRPLEHPVDLLVRRVAAGLAGMGRQSCCDRSEEHTSELQSHSDLVCRLLLEKKKKKKNENKTHKKK